MFLPPGQVAPDFRKIWKAAAFRPSGSRPAPQFAATDGGSEIRPIKRSEGTILGYCMHAVIDTISRGKLYPPDVSNGVEATLLVNVPGDDPDAFEDAVLPGAQVDVVGWPDVGGELPRARVVAEEVKASAEARDELMDRIIDTLGARPTHGLLRSGGAKLGAIWQRMVPQLEGALRRVRST